MMKKVLLTLAMVMLVVSPVLAFDLGGYTGDLVFKYGDFSTGTIYSFDGANWHPAGHPEISIPNATYGQAALYPAEDAWGIARITSIESADGSSQLWSELSANEQLTVMYYGVNDDYVNVYGNGFEVQSLGGHMDVWLQDKAGLGYTAYSGVGGPAARTGAASYPAVTDGTLFLSTEFTSGILFGDGILANDNITYRSLFDPTLTGFTPQALGNFYLNVTGGAYASMFDSNSFLLTDDSGATKTADLEANFRGNTPGSFGWLVNSQDPVGGKVIPEPASMILMGIGLAGAARLRRRTA